MTAIFIEVVVGKREDHLVRERRRHRSGCLVANRKNSVQVARREREFLSLHRLLAYSVDLTQYLANRFGGNVGSHGRRDDEGSCIATPVEGREGPVGVRVRLA